jgi:hypothetical protein
MMRKFAVTAAGNGRSTILSRHRSVELADQALAWLGGRYVVDPQFQNVQVKELVGAGRLRKFAVIATGDAQSRFIISRHSTRKLAEQAAAKQRRYTDFTQLTDIRIEEEPPAPVGLKLVIPGWSRLQ